MSPGFAYSQMGAWAQHVEAGYHPSDPMAPIIPTWVDAAHLDRVMALSALNSRYSVPSLALRMFVYYKGCS
jgi:hypothetical protein